ncbi:hypothetical protein AAG570_007690 [Ranatra chinensis]|uniref:glutamine--tRNA ligase n=1 Tax=Ranatra chinensis TaxID=642074 RepID=A0ABD0XUA7_9HEMI
MGLGLSEQKAKETVKNSTLCSTLLFLCKEAKVHGGFPEGYGSIVYYLASKVKSQLNCHLALLCKYICERKLDSLIRVDAAMAFLIKNVGKDLDILDFESACGIGISVSPEDIEFAVESVMNKYKQDIIEKRYKFNVGSLVQEVRSVLKWADGKDVKNEIDVQLLDILGPKTEADRMPLDKEVRKVSNQDHKTKTKSKHTNLPESHKNEKESDGSISIMDMMSKANFHRPGFNFETDGYIVTSTTHSLLEEHLRITGGQVRTRFPPEPNGILHIGHAKAININFGYAAYHKGICFLRYDDTNPEKEEEKYFTGIREMVEWLGYAPDKVTYSSDYFETLYKWAVELINKNLAYVCHQRQEDIKGFNPPPSPWRDRPKQESLLLFESMKNGKMEEGECTLRLKVTLEEGKQDPVAYRIKYIPHHRTGLRWCIYPTYDYTHCLCDSIENITHSLCTKEFQSRRSSYYWLCNALNIYCPVQWEYGRLNMNYAIVSKRKIAMLIEQGVVRDWDDPRLFTLSGLRRRGFPPEAINAFCAKIGLTGAQTSVDPCMLEACVRDTLNTTAPRAMVVLKPLRLVIVEGPREDRYVNVPDYPSHPEKGFHKITFSQVIYIERSDFKLEADKNYRRLTPNQTVGLKHAGIVLKFMDILYNADGSIDEIRVESYPVNDVNKPKAFIHWVAWPVNIRVRLYQNLFSHKNPEDPEEVPDGFLSDVRSDSFEEIGAFADSSLFNDISPFKQYQFERLGYFAVDPDSDGLTVRVIFFLRCLLI